MTIRGFKYYVSPTEDRKGWEVCNDEAEVMGVYASQAEAHAAITEFVHTDMEELMAAHYDNQNEMRRNHRGDD